MHSASIVLEGMENLMGALLPEINEKIPRTKASIGKDDGNLVINIEAEDTTALKAGLSSYLRWISAAMSVKKVMEE